MSNPVISWTISAISPTDVGFLSNHNPHKTIRLQPQSTIQRDKHPDPADNRPRENSFLCCDSSAISWRYSKEIFGRYSMAISRKYSKEDTLMLMMPVEWIPGSSALRETLETRQIGKSHGNKSCLQRRSLNLAQGKFMEGENLESSRENLR